MADPIINGTTIDVAELITSLGEIGLWIQGLGLIVIFWIIIQAVTLFLNRRKRKAIYNIKEDVSTLKSQLNRLEKKIDKITKKR